MRREVDSKLQIMKLYPDKLSAGINLETIPCKIKFESSWDQVGTKLGSSLEKCFLRREY